MKGIELLKRLHKINKSFYTVTDLEKITALSKNSLYVSLKRWADEGIIERVGQGIYLPMAGTISMEYIAAQLYLPNYLSFESALAKHGILNLIPYGITFATTRRTRHYTLRDQDIEFRQIASELFFGFEMKSGIHIASPEKAFLDQVYFMTRGKSSLDLDELSIKKLSPKILRKYAQRFPAYVRRQIGLIEEVDHGFEQHE